MILELGCFSNPRKESSVSFQLADFYLGDGDSPEIFLRCKTFATLRHGGDEMLSH